MLLSFAMLVVDVVEKVVELRSGWGEVVGREKLGV